MLVTTLATENVTSPGPPVGPEDPYDRAEVLKSLLSSLAMLRFDDETKVLLARACHVFAEALDTCKGKSLQERWIAFEQTVWPKWKAIRDPNRSAKRTWGGAWIAVVTRHVRPTAKWLASMRLLEWIKHLPDGDPLAEQRQTLARALETVRWAGTKLCKQVALANGLRILLIRGYSSLTQITDKDLALLLYPKGADILDSALCALGVFGRTPRRAARRGQRQGQLIVSQMVVAAGIPERFRLVSSLYLETYAARISDTYTTRRNKAVALGQFWRFISEQYPDVASSSQVLPVHARAFIADALRRKGTTQTAHAWVITVRTSLRISVVGRANKTPRFLPSRRRQCR